MIVSAIMIVCVCDGVRFFFPVAKDWMMYHGSCLEVKKVDRQTLHNVELVEVLFDTEGAVETLADADAEQSAFHMV